MRHPVVLFKDLLDDRLPQGSLRRWLGRLGWGLLGGRNSEKLVRRHINGQSLRLEARCVVFTKEYERHVFDWIDQHLPAGGLLLDVGAHHGLMALPLLAKASQRRAILVEASSANCSVLTHNVQANGFTERAAVCHLAVADTDDEQRSLSLLYEGISMSNRLGTSSLPLAGTESVRTVRIDTLVQRLKAVPDVVKIDIEGFEVRALRGLTQTLATQRPHLIIALHYPWIAELGDDVNELYATLAAHGYRVEHFDHQVAGQCELEEVKCYPPQSGSPL